MTPASFLFFIIEVNPSNTEAAGLDAIDLFGLCVVDIQQVDAGIMRCAAKTLDMQPWTKSPVALLFPRG